MFNSFGSMDLYSDAETAYRGERIQRDFAAITSAAEQRVDQWARAAESRAAGQPAPVPARRPSRIARWHRALLPAAH